MIKTGITLKKFLQDFLLSITSIIIIILLFELILRLDGYYPHKISIAPPYLFSNHPVTWWTLTPNYNYKIHTPDGVVTYSINSQGIRASQKLAEHSSKPRLFIIGDSYTFGAGINEDMTFPYVLDNILKEQSIDMQVVNLGVIGFGTGQSYERLLEYSELLGEPKIVIYFFCPNDPVDNMAGEKQVVWGIRIDEMRKHKKILAVVGHCYFKSRAAAFIIDRVYDKWYNPRKLKKAELEKQIVPIEKRQDFIVTQNYLSLLIDWTSDHHINLLVVTTSPSRFSQPLHNFIQARQIPMLETNDILKCFNTEKQPVNLIEGHWNKCGHRLVAYSLADYLMKQGWL